MSALPADARRVLDFWFAPPGDPEHGRFRELWFVKRDATDRDMTQRFDPLIDDALAGRLDAWDATLDGALARILLLDQFTRNVHRGTPKSFAGDAAALASARAMVADGRDRRLPALQRAFVYMPFEHAEDGAMQDEAVRLFEALHREDASMAEMLDYARRHRDVIRRFGRFPHRNAIVGRVSTPEEAAYLAQPGAGF